jgi:nucleotide-binding universal stress UspA family protein
MLHRDEGPRAESGVAAAKEPPRMFKTILVAVDGSSHAAEAVKTAAGLAARLDARLVLVHVLMQGATAADIRAIADLRRLPKTIRGEIDALEMPVAAAAMGGGLIGVPAPLPVLKAVGEQILDRAKAVAGRARAKKIAAHIVGGDPAEAILQRARREKADLVVLGSRGLGTLRGLVLGSVSHKVAQLAKMPCLIVK